MTQSQSKHAHTAPDTPASTGAGGSARSSMGRTLRYVPITCLVVNAQIRKHFDEDQLEDLTRSVREEGILQPLAVRPVGQGRYMVIMGERRLQAAKRAGLREVPIQEITTDASSLRRLQVVENLQRSNLNVIERTEAVLSLYCEQFGMSEDRAVARLRRLRLQSQQGQEGVAAEVQATDEFFRSFGLRWQTFSESDLRNLKIPGDLKAACRSRGLCVSKARELSRLEDTALRTQVTQRTLDERWTLIRTREEVASELGIKRVRQTPRLSLTASVQGDIQKLPAARQRAILSLLRQIEGLMSRPQATRSPATARSGSARSTAQAGRGKSGGQTRSGTAGSASAKQGQTTSRTHDLTLGYSSEEQTPG